MHQNYSTYDFSSYFNKEFTKADVHTEKKKKELHHMIDFLQIYIIYCLHRTTLPPTAILNLFVEIEIINFAIIFYKSMCMNPAEVLNY